MKNGQAVLDFGDRNEAKPAFGRDHAELVIDNFAGGGGASMGIEEALGRAVDIAINHDRAAVEMHSINHPATKHLCEDVWSVDPLKATGGRQVGLAWFSPDCKHFSLAKGGKPIEKKIRGLAWVVVRWAKAVKPRVIILENVREFETWGPLNGDNMPCPRRKGLTFKRWVGRLRGLGYVVEWKTLNASDFGAPTHRRRLFLIARRDGEPIVWPEPTHGPGRSKPWRTAAECIDWSIPCPSIFLTKAEGRAIGVIRPLAEKTQRRIAMGLKRYVLDDPKPFIVTCNHGGPEFRGQAVEEPMSTVTGLAAAFVNRHFGGPRPVLGSGLDSPLPTVTAVDHHSVTAASLMKFRGDSDGSSAESPVPTITAGGDCERPAGAAHALGLQAATLSHFQGTNNGNGGDLRQPLTSVTAQGNHAAVVAFLLKYYGTAVGQYLSEPVHTITGTDRFAIVNVDGLPYAIADIGMRMLRPRELARAQGFPDSYVFKGSNAFQVKMIGNSVAPVMGDVLVRANYRCERVPVKRGRRAVGV